MVSQMRTWHIVSVVVTVIGLACVRAQQLGACDPIDPSLCSLPFPNNFWLRQAPDGSMKLQFAGHTFPSDNFGKYFDPAAGGWNDLDGFSGIMPINTYMGNVSISNLPPYWNMTLSTAAGSPSILLDTVTGKPVPHFVEVDHSSDSDHKNPDRMLTMWPAQRLQYSRRYIVAYRNLVDATSGAPLPPSRAFMCLRDNLNSTDPNINLRRALFADIFSRLSAAGFAQSSLQIAWDFTTGSQPSTNGRLLAMRDDGFKRMPAAGPAYKIMSVQQNTSSDTAAIIELQIMVPQYVNSPNPGATLVLNSKGVPVYQGDGPVNVTVWVPMSLAYGGIPPSGASVLQYGHGLFGSRHEAGDGYLQAQANAYGYVIVASDWIGLSDEDEVPVAEMFATDFTRFKMVPDRSQQGVWQALALMRFMNGAFLKDPVMNFGRGPVLPQGAPKYYYGNSQGGILGSVYMAVTTDVTRGTLGVYGGPYSLLIIRSVDYVGSLGEIMNLRYSDPLTRMQMTAVLQLLWDRADPGGYMSSITTAPLPNTPPHQLLLHNALGDAQVTYLGAYALARSAGAVMFASNVCEPGEPLFGFNFIPDNARGSGAVAVTWDFPNVPPVPRTNVPPQQSTDTHDGPRMQTDSQQMMNIFFQTGEVFNLCDGPCHGTMPSRRS